MILTPRINKVEINKYINLNPSRIRHGKVLGKGGKYMDELSKTFYLELSLSVTGLARTTKLAFTTVSLN